MGYMFVVACVMICLGYGVEGYAWYVLRENTVFMLIGRWSVNISYQQLPLVISV